MDIGQGLANFGEGIAGAMEQYHKEHEAYDQQLGIAQAMSRMGVDTQGNIVQINPNVKDKTIKPIIDPSALDQFTNAKKIDRAEALGRLKMLTELGMSSARQRAASGVEDASLSGQATSQRMTQSAQEFPYQLEETKARTAHLQKITEDEGKVNVPGFGMMTPSQYSAHVIRQERLDVLKKKSEPILQFENQTLSKYGLGMQDIVDATKGTFPALDSKGNPVKDANGKPITYTGVPFVDAAGGRVQVKNGQFLDTKGNVIKYDPKNPSVWAQVGPNQAVIPAHEWSSLASKAKSFSDRLGQIQNDQSKLQGQMQTQQAQQVIAILKNKALNQMTPEEQAAFTKAKSILGQ